MLARFVNWSLRLAPCPIDNKIGKQSPSGKKCVFTTYNNTIIYTLINYIKNRKKINLIIY